MSSVWHGSWHTWSVFHLLVAPNISRGNDNQDNSNSLSIFVIKCYLIFDIYEPQSLMKWYKWMIIWPLELFMYVGYLTSKMTSSIISVCPFWRNILVFIIDEGRSKVWWHTLQIALEETPIPTEADTNFDIDSQKLPHSVLFNFGWAWPKIRCWGPMKCQFQNKCLGHTHTHTQTVVLGRKIGSM